MQKFTLLFIAVVCSCFTWGQSMVGLNSIVFLNEAGDTLKSPFIGGLNAPQFSSIDIDFDGTEDLFIHDRDGQIVKTFINGGTPDSVDYTYAPQYISKFPQMKNYALLVDYNCDGKKDIFTGAVGGMKVYKNTGNASIGLQFELVTDLLMSDYNPNILNLYVPNTDIPAITDMDNDGDIDVLSFGVFGTRVEYHENLSMDLYGTCDSLKFRLGSSCWGNFEENSNNNSVTLGSTCKGNTPNTSPSHNIHSGSTLLAIDMDDDGDKELILGDVSFANMVILTNGGDSITANITAQSDSFPTSSIGVNVEIFPAGYYLDVNNDDVKDLIVAPNSGNITENFKGVLYYKNNGTNTAPIFEYQQNDFFQEDMVEVGAGASPVLFDINQDGLQDIIVGNYGYYGTPEYTSSLAYYQNIGSQEVPTYQLITRDFSNLSAAGLLSLSPSFGDIDNDNYPDMIVGELEGHVHYYESNSPIGSLLEFDLVESYYKDIDVGQISNPQIVDYNRDGLNDLIIGERSGNINYYENTGTSTTPNFADTATTDMLGNIDVMIPCCTGYSYPHLEFSSGFPKLYVASESGTILIYTDVDTVNYNASFTLSDSINTFGYRTTCYIGNIDSTEGNEVLVGEYGGGIYIFGEAQDLFLIYPPNGATAITPDVTLDWNATNEAALNYQIEVDTTPLFDSPLLIQQEQSYISSVSTNSDSEIELTNLLWLEKYFWRVRFTTVNDTSDWSETWNFIVKDSVNFLSQEHPGNLIIFPNPANNSITVEKSYQETSQLNIHSINGQLVQNEIIREQKTVVDLNHPAGVYILSITNAKEATRIKLIIE